MFPVPVRASRFLATSRFWSRFNIEVAHDLVTPFCFGRAANASPLLFYDYQTQLEANAYGRLGSGRGGVYRGRYLKGIGRTPAAGNWHELADRFHGSGHLSITSALRERLVTVLLSSRGLRHTIVPCDAVLIGPLSRSEQKAVRDGVSSSNPEFTRADSCMCAMTVKPADFARPTNFVFAFSNLPAVPYSFGNLFLDFERYLHSPGDRKNLEGEPANIARAMEAAFFRGIENFEAFARAGLLWVYIQSNFTLDGRFLDLETPHYFGSPFVGARTGDPPYGSGFVGFEEFHLVSHWRRFLVWLDGRITFLYQPGILQRPELRLFLQQFKQEIAKRFGRNHLLFQDIELQKRATANLSKSLQLGSHASKRLYELARSAFRATVYGAAPPKPDRYWRDVKFTPASPIPVRFQYQSPDFLEPILTADAHDFALQLEQLGDLRSIDLLLEALGRLRR